MHLLAGDVARIDDGDAAIDLGLPPGDIVFLSAADTELALSGKSAAERGSDAPSVRFANLGRLSHPMSVDHFLEATVRHAKHVVVRCMGGASYWSYGLVELRRICHMYRISCAVIPGDDRWDPGLKEYSTVEPEQARQLWRYLVEGAEENARLALALCDHLIGRGPLPPSPVVQPHAGCYWPGRGAVELSEIVSHIKGMPVAAVVFYRALMQGNSTAPIDALIEALRSEGIAALPIFVASLKDAESEAFLDQAFSLIPPTVVLNTTAFAVSKIGTARSPDLRHGEGGGVEDDRRRDQAKCLIQKGFRLRVLQAGDEDRQCGDAFAPQCLDQSIDGGGGISLHQRPIEDYRRNRHTFDVTDDFGKLDSAAARPVTAGMRQDNRRRRQRPATYQMIAERQREPRIFLCPFNQIAPELAGLLRLDGRVFLQPRIPAVVAGNDRARNPVHMADTAQLHEPVRPVGCAAHAAYHHVLRVPNRRLEEMVDRHRMAEPAEVREADGGSIRTPLRRDLPDQRQFGVGGGKKNDVARRQAQIDGGIAVVDAGHVAGEQVHRLA